MPTSRSTKILGVATVVALATAGWLTAGTAFADDTPVPEATSTPTVSPTEPAAPVFTPTNDEPTGDPKPELLVEPDVYAGAGTASGNSFSNAQSLNVSGSFWGGKLFDSTSATIQSGEPRKLLQGWYLQRTMWAKWKAPATGYVSVSATAGSADTGLNVYTGSSLSKLKKVASNDQQYNPVVGAAGTASNPPSGAKVLSLKVTSGKTYYIQFGTPQYNSSSTPMVSGFTDFQVSIQANRYFPKNDFFADAKELKLGTGGTVTTNALLNGSTMEAWEPSDNDEVAGNVRTASVWFKYTPVQTGFMTFKTCAGVSAPTVAVFRTAYTDSNIAGAGYGDLQSIAFDYNGNLNCDDVSSGGLVTVSATKNVTYYLQVGWATPGNTPYDARVTVQGVFLIPYLEKLSKTSGGSGTTITITGQALASADYVKFGSKTASIISATATSVVVKAPSQGGHKGKVSVTVVDGVNVSNKGSFTYK